MTDLAPVRRRRFPSRVLHRLDCLCHAGADAVEDGGVRKGALPRRLLRLRLEREDGRIVVSGRAP